MVDRVSASITMTITIGGALPHEHLPAFITRVTDEGLTTAWDGEPFDAGALPQGVPLRLVAHEVAWGRFDQLEAFCIRHGLPFARWSGACAGQWGAKRTVFTGSGAKECYAADEDDCILMGRVYRRTTGKHGGDPGAFRCGGFCDPAAGNHRSGGADRKGVGATKAGDGVRIGCEIGHLCAPCGFHSPRPARGYLRLRMTCLSASQRLHAPRLASNSRIPASSLKPV